MKEALMLALCDAASQLAGDGVDLSDPIVRQEVKEAVNYLLVEVGMYDVTTATTGHAKARIVFPKAV